MSWYQVKHSVVATVTVAVEARTPEEALEKSADVIWTEWKWWQHGAEWRLEENEPVGEPVKWPET